MRFEVLGPLRVQRDDETIPLTSGRQRALLANLLIAAGNVVPTDRLIDAIWGDALPANPANTLQHGVAQLRKLLEPGRSRSDPPRVIISEGAGYRLDLNGHTADMEQFQAALDSGREALEGGEARRAVDILTAALAVWRGPAYADFTYADFARAESERLDELRIQGRELLVDARSVAGGPASVVADLEGLVVEYPYREGLWSRLMQALYQTGRQAEALRVYAQAGRVLGDELGIEPSLELQELEEQILLHDPSLAPTQPRSPRHNLPAVKTSFIGREKTLDQVLQYLRTARLTTLLGPGGSGKTRLAIEAAHRSVDGFADGVWLVRLDDLADGELLVATVGSVVGMPEDRDKAVIETLTDHLAERRSLLILDNCEHLIEAVAALADALLAACPSLVILTTSQEALNVTGEQRLVVPPLGLPGEQGSPFDDLETVAAVELFLERASATNPDIDHSPASIAAISNIVQALDGMPLAIELAAARTDLLAPVEIARRLADRFEILDSGPRDVPRRQRTLHNTVEWSVGLLNPSERSCFARLSVFSGGFDIEAAAAVTGTDAAAALTMLGRLVQRSLVNRQPSVGGEPRFRLLETLRIHGTIGLERRADLDGTRDLHLDHYAERTLRYDEELSGSRQMAAYEALVADQDNLRAAMRWSIESGRQAPGMRIAARAGRFWDWRGSLAEALTWTNRFLDAVSDESVPDYSLVVAWAGYFAWELGDGDRSRDLVARAKRIATEQGNDHSRAVALSGQALHARVGGRAAEAVRLNDEVRRISAQIGELWLAAWADNHDGLSLLGVGDIDGAEEAGQASLSGFRDLGDRRASGWALTVLAQVAHARGDYPRVIELADEAMRVSRQVGDGRNAAWALELAAEAARASGDEAQARRFEADAADLLRERGMPESPWRRST